MIATVTKTPMVEIISSYNAMAEALGEVCVNRFSNREVAIRRHAAIIERYDAWSQRSLQDTATIEAQAATARNGGRPTTELEAKLDAAVTKVAPGLAVGAHGKDAVHSRKSLDDQRHPAKAPKDEPEVAVTKKLRTPSTVTVTTKKGSSSKLILKANKEVRAQLMAACQKLGGTRLQPAAFETYTDFLAGIPLDNGVARQTLAPMKGNSVVATNGMHHVVLLVADGKIKVTTIKL